MTNDIAALYWTMCSIPLVALAAVLLPLVPRNGVRFTTVPAREQALSLSLLAFAAVVSALALKRLDLAAFMGLCDLVILAQSWGPKRWHNGRVYGAYLFPVKIKSWEKLDGKVLVQVGAGGQLLVHESDANVAFLGVLADPTTRDHASASSE